MRRGFTLMEMILVMALLVITTALVAPSVESLSWSQRMTNAGDVIRARWSAARTHAINDGVAYRFGLVWDSGNWRVAPDSDDYWTGGGEGPSDSPPAFIDAGSLPKGIRFTSTNNLQQPYNPTDQGQEPPITDVSAYSRCVVFYPDGTASCYLADGSSADLLYIAVQSSGSRGLVVSLRALTGVVTTRWSDQLDAQ